MLALHAKNTAIEILGSSRLRAAWGANHHSRKNNNPADSIAQEIINLCDALQNHPELITFIREMVNIEFQSLGKVKKDESAERRALRKYLNDISDYLNTLPAEGCKAENLPQNYQEILQVMRNETGQVPLRPISAAWEMTKHIAGDFWEQTKAHPIGMSAAAGIVYFMISRGSALSGRSYIDPESTMISQISTAQLLGEEPIVYDSSRLDMAYQACHSHLSYLTLGNQELAKQIGDGLARVVGKDTYFQHCITVDKGLFNAQRLADSVSGGFNNFLDTINTRYDVLVLGPALDFMHRISSDGRFYDTYNNVAMATNEILKTANKYENAILHPIILGSAYYATYKLGRMDKDEYGKAWRKVCDFSMRAWHNSKLKMLMCASASGYAISLNGGYHPMAIWAGVAGFTFGHIFENILRQRSGPAFVQETVLSVPKSEAVHADAHEIVLADKQGSSWQRVRLPVAGAAITTMASAMDFSFNNGQGTASVLGIGSIAVPFLLVNIPEDISAHGIFGFAGSILGLGAAFGRNMYERAVGLFKDKTFKALDI